jgi:hypothetical protein
MFFVMVFGMFSKSIGVRQWFFERLFKSIDLGDGFLGALGWA